MAVLFNQTEKQLTAIKLSKPAVRPLALFCYQMGAMLEAGLPLLSCLALNRQEAPDFLQTALLTVEQDLKQGGTLAGALSRHPGVFPALMVSMVEAGELGGILPQVFSWLADYYERENKLLEDIKSALVYPMLVLVLTLISLVIMFTFILPNFAYNLQSMGVPLPAITKAVLGLNSLLNRWGFFPVLVILIVGVACHLLYQRPETRLWWDRTVIRFPIVGELLVKVMAARFCRLLGALLASGVPIVQAVIVVRKTLGNEVLKRSLDQVRINLEEGKGLARPLTQTGLFSPLLVQMVASGEETGRLPEFLQRLSTHYDQEVQRTLDRLIKLLEPTLVLILGCLVGGVVLALLWPMLNVLTAF